MEKYWKELKKYQEDFISLFRFIKERIESNEQKKVFSLLEKLDALIDKVQELELHFVFPTNYPLSLEIFEAREEVNKDLGISEQKFE